MTNTISNKAKMKEVFLAMCNYKNPTAKLISNFCKERGIYKPNKQDLIKKDRLLDLYSDYIIKEKKKLNSSKRQGYVFEFKNNRATFKLLIDIFNDQKDLKSLMSTPYFLNTYIDILLDLFFPSFQKWLDEGYYERSDVNKIESSTLRKSEKIRRKKLINQLKYKEDFVGIKEIPIDEYRIKKLIFAKSVLTPYFFKEVILYTLELKEKRIKDEYYYNAEDDLLVPVKVFHIIRAFLALTNKTKFANDITPAEFERQNKIRDMEEAKARDMI